MTPGCVTHTTDRSFFVWNHTGSTGIVITGQFGGAGNYPVAVFVRDELVSCLRAFSDSAVLLCAS